MYFSNKTPEMQLSWSDGKDVLKPFPKYEHDKIVLAYTIVSKLIFKMHKLKNLYKL